MRCHWSTLYQEFLYRNLELSIRIINFDCPIFSFWTLDNSHTWVQHQSPEIKGHQAGRRHDCCCVIFRWPPSRCYVPRRAARSPLTRGEAADQDQVPRSEVLPPRTTGLNQHSLCHLSHDFASLREPVKKSVENSTLGVGVQTGSFSTLFFKKKIISFV